MELEAPILDDPAVISDLLHEMAKPIGFSIAVLHRNPYLHVAVTDYLDGSNFDAFVTEHDRIVIHPGYRATAEALGRFTQAISDRFGARSVEEIAAASPPTLTDLLTTG